MNFRSLPVSITIAIVIGIAQMFLLTVYWAYVGVRSPVFSWLIDLGLEGISLRAVIFPIDFFTNVLLSLPAAYVIYKLHPKYIWLYLALAVLPVFVFTNRLLISEPERLTHFVSWYAFGPGWIFGLAILPVAVLIIHRLTMRSTRTPTKSAPVS